MSSKIILWIWFIKVDWAILISKGLILISWDQSIWATWWETDRYILIFRKNYQRYNLGRNWGTNVENQQPRGYDVRFVAILATNFISGASVTLISGNIQKHTRPPYLEKFWSLRGHYDDLFKLIQLCLRFLWFTHKKCSSPPPARFHSMLLDPVHSRDVPRLRSLRNRIP